MAKEEERSGRKYERRNAETCGRVDQKAREIKRCTDSGTFVSTVYTPAVAGVRIQRIKSQLLTSENSIKDPNK